MLLGLLLLNFMCLVPLSINGMDNSLFHDWSPSQQEREYLKTIYENNHEIQKISDFLSFTGFVSAIVVNPLFVVPACYFLFHANSIQDERIDCSYRLCKNKSSMQWVIRDYLQRYGTDASKPIEQRLKELSQRSVFNPINYVLNLPDHPLKP